MTIAVQNRWNSAHSPSYSHSAFVKVVWRCFLSALWGVWGVWTVRRVESSAVNVIFMVFLKKKKNVMSLRRACFFLRESDFTWINSKRSLIFFFLPGTESESAQLRTREILGKRGRGFQYSRTPTLKRSVSASEVNSTGYCDSVKKKKAIKPPH